MLSMDCVIQSLKKYLDPDMISVFTGEETDAQRNQKNYPRTHN